MDLPTPKDSSQSFTALETSFTITRQFVGIGQRYSYDIHFQGLVLPSGADLGFCCLNGCVFNYLQLVLKQICVEIKSEFTSFLCPCLIVIAFKKCKA